MKGLNKVMLIGRLGRNPELRYTSTGQAVAKFSIATDESWVDKNGNRQNRTEWHNIVAWGKLGEICNTYLKKGSLVYVEGRLQTRNWDDSSGNKRFTTEIIISDMSMLEPRGAGNQFMKNTSETASKTTSTPASSVPTSDDTLPTDDGIITDAPIVDDDDVPF